MRSLEAARDSWRELSQYRSLRDLKHAIRVETHSGPSAVAGLRSVTWRAFLLFESLDLAEWQRITVASRSAYNSLRSHFFRYLENPDEVTSLDPLGQDAESSPWSKMHKDEELRAEILQDVERIGTPSVEYFQQRERQQMLLDILFVFCKLNPDVGYRQGMHEIAGSILFVVEHDAIDVGGISKTLGEDGIIRTVFDADHIEHDTFALFGQIMQSAKHFYLSDGPVSIATRSRHIFNELLSQVDPDLVKHLEGLDIVPQVFLIRWVRLLFGREFGFEAVLALWDAIFAEDASLELVDHICLAMLLRIRWHLLDADYNSALSLLLRYPELDKDFPAQTFALDALYLKTHMTVEGGSYLVLKYTGRPLVLGRPTTPPALQRNITTFAIRQAPHPERKTRLSPTRAPRSSNNIEAMLQNTAKNLYARGEKLGIGKAVRTAVDEVQKKAQEIREAQTSTSPAWPKSGNVRLLDHVKDLELRNKKLAGLLAGAVNELWEYQRLVSEQKAINDQEEDAEIVEKLSTAIAKVQFVQVYLDEPSLSLDDVHPVDEQSVSTGPDLTQLAPELSVEKPSHAEPSATKTYPPAVLTVPTLVDQSTLENNRSPLKSTKPDSTAAVEDKGDAVRSLEKLAKTGVEPAPSTRAPRPQLEQSAFSFMLDSQGDSKSVLHDKSSARDRTSDSLFGGHNRSHSGQVKGAALAPKDPLAKAGDDADDFDISSLRRAKGARK